MPGNFVPFLRSFTCDARRMEQGSKLFYSPESNSLFLVSKKRAGHIWGVPRANPLQPREAAICGRVKEVRIRTKLPRTTFARDAGIDSSTLVRVEHQLAPLRFETAWRLISLLHVHPTWLAEGTGDSVFFAVEQFQVLANTIDPKALFSQTYDETLKRVIAASFSKDMHALLAIRDQFAEAAALIPKVNSVPFTETQLKQIYPQMKHIVRLLRRVATVGK